MKATYKQNLTVSALVGVLAISGHATHAHAQKAPKMKTDIPAAAGSAYKFEAGYPTQETSQRLYDELDYRRAVQAYIWAVPLVNSAALEKADSIGGSALWSRCCFRNDSRRLLA